MIGVEGMKRVVVTNGWIKEWDRPNVFTLVFETESEEDRETLLNSMRDNIPLCVTVEVKE